MVTCSLPLLILRLPIRWQRVAIEEETAREEERLRAELKADMEARVRSEVQGRLAAAARADAEAALRSSIAEEVRRLCPLAWSAETLSLPGSATRECCLEVPLVSAMRGSRQPARGGHAIARPQVRRQVDTAEVRGRLRKEEEERVAEAIKAEVLRGGVREAMREKEERRIGTVIEAEVRRRGAFLEEMHEGAE